MTDECPICKQKIVENHEVIVSSGSEYYPQNYSNLWFYAFDWVCCSYKIIVKKVINLDDNKVKWCGLEFWDGNDFKDRYKTKYECQMYDYLNSRCETLLLKQKIRSRAKPDVSRLH